MNKWWTVLLGTGPRPWLPRVGGSWCVAGWKAKMASAGRSNPPPKLIRGSPWLWHTPVRPGPLSPCVVHQSWHDRRWWSGQWGIAVAVARARADVEGCTGQCFNSGDSPNRWDVEGGGGVAATRCCFGDDGVFWWPPVISDVPCRHDGGRVMSEGRLSGKKGSEGGSPRKQRKVGAPAKF
jgi:hypothetical protein